MRGAVALGVTAHRVERPEDLRPEWFATVERVGVTAGTSTLDESVRAVLDRLKMLPSEIEARRSGLLARIAG